MNSGDAPCVREPPAPGFRQFQLSLTASALTESLSPVPVLQPAFPLGGLDVANQINSISSSILAIQTAAQFAQAPSHIYTKHFKGESGLKFYE